MFQDTHKIQEVIDGLRKGHSFERKLGCGGTEYVSPSACLDYFNHDVAGRDGGGAATLPISILSSVDAVGEDRWAQVGWVRTH